MSSRTKRSLINIKFGIISKIIGMIFPFIIKSIIIRTIGAQYLGLNSLFTSILQVLSLSELGVGSAMVYSMYKPLAEKNHKKICALLNIYRKFYRIIGLIILLIGLLLMPFIKYFIKGSYPADINLYSLYAIYLVNTVLSYFLFAYKKSLWEANQQSSYDTLITTIVNICMYIIQIIILLLLKSYYFYILLLPFSTLVINLVRNEWISKMYPHYKCNGTLEPLEIQIIFNKVLALFGHKIGTTIITSTDNIVISSFLGLEVLAIYSNYHYVYSAIIGLVSIIYFSITASIGNSLITNNKANNYQNFLTLTFLNIWLVGWCTICLFSLIQPFITLWVGEKMLISRNEVIIFCVYFYTWLSRRMGLTFKDAAGMWSDDFYKPYIGAVLNIVGNLVFVRILGIKGVLLSTIIVMTLIYFPIETVVIFKRLFERDMKEYLIKYILGTIVIFFLAVITEFMTSLILIGGLIGLLIKSIICLLLPNLIFIMLFARTKEFKDFYTRAKSLLH